MNATRAGILGSFHPLQAVSTCSVSISVVLSDVSIMLVQCGILLLLLFLVAFSFDAPFNFYALTMYESSFLNFASCLGMPA